MLANLGNVYRFRPKSTGLGPISVNFGPHSGGPVWAKIGLRSDNCSGMLMGQRNAQAREAISGGATSEFLGRGSHTQFLCRKAGWTRMLWRRLSFAVKSHVRSNYPYAPGGGNHGPKLTEYQRNLGRLRPTCGRSQPNYDRVRHEFGRYRSKLGQIRPDVGRVGPEFGRAPSNVDQNMFGAEIDPCLAETNPDLVALASNVVGTGQHAAEIGTSGPTFGPHRPKFGRHRVKLGQHGPTFG